MYSSESMWHYAGDRVVLINPTNLQGPMGAGIAKVFRDSVVGLEERYKKFLKQGWPYRLYTAQTERGLIVCLPTKFAWSRPANVELIRFGLQRIYDRIPTDYTIVMPRIGCGLGGLDWDKNVLPLVNEYLVSGYPLVVCDGRMDVLSPPIEIEKEFIL